MFVLNAHELFSVNMMTGEKVDTLFVQSCTAAPMADRYSSFVMDGPDVLATRFIASGVVVIVDRWRRSLRNAWLHACLS